MDGSHDARCNDPQSSVFLELISQQIIDWEVLAPYFSLRVQALTTINLFRNVQVGVD